MARVSEGPHAFFRLGPAESGKAQCFALQRGEVHRRFDPANHRPEIREKLVRLASHETVTLGSITRLWYRYPTFYGFDYQASGILVLKGENIGREGDLVVREDPSYISEDIHTRFPRTQLEEGDLIVSVRGEVGKVGLIPMELAGSNINANTIRIALHDRVKTEEFLPAFIWLYLNSEVGQMLIRQFIAGGVQETITAPELLEVRIPRFDIGHQRTIVATLDAARSERRAKQAEADELLAGLDNYLLDILDLNLPPRHEQKVFAVTRGAAPTRFDPHFHLPAFAQNQRMLATNGGEPLGNIATFSKKVWKPEKHDAPTFRYIEISSVDRDTGEAQAVETLVAEAPSRARMAVHTGDIIVSLTSPHHVSIAQITPALDGCVASTGFSVIRNAEESRVLSDYLWCILRSKMCLTQMLQRASGGNYPAITEPELAKVLIPIPTMDIQNTIAAEARRRRDESRRLRAEADSGWQAAKLWFEEQLLGPVHK